jgi:hypothetical protein
LEQDQDMQALIEYFAKEGRVIFQAPIAFAVALAIIFGLVWAAVSWSFQSRFDGQSSAISSLENRVKLKDDQIGEYKEKLSGATPEEAKKRIDALELQIKALSPRRVSLEQRQHITDALRGMKGNISIVQDMAAADAKPLTADLASAFQAAGWGVSLPMIMGPSNVPTSGLAVRVENPGNLRPVQQAVVSALKAVGLDFDLQAGIRKAPPIPDPPPGYPRVPSEMSPDVELLLTTRVN